MTSVWNQQLQEKARGENFPVALRVLPGRVRRHLQALYSFARTVDDLGDEYRGDRTAALQEVADDVHRMYAGRPPATSVVQGIRRLVAECQVPAHPWLRLVEANLQDQHVARYDTFGQLRDYCAKSADPVGEVVLHIFGCATPGRIALSGRVCTALQLVEHLQDLAEDYRAGRIYLPQQDMAAFGVAEADLAAPSATPELAALVRFETDRAATWLDAGAGLLPELRGWARVCVAGYVAGGRATVSALRRCGHDTLSASAEPTRTELLAALVATRRRPR